MLLAVTVILAPTRAFAAGWLSAFVFLSMIPIGSIGLLLLHGITGGRWGEDFAPVLVPAARAMPIFLLAFLPILLLRPDLYDWPAHGVPVDVARDYLNPPFFAFRTIAALIIWSAMAWSRMWKSQLWSAVGLFIHGVLVSLIPPDWVLTLRPFSTSAAFGFGFGIEQFLAALAFVALLAPQGADPRANRDLAGAMISALLGTVYFDFMAFLITWYGNIPEKVAWYVARTYGAWPAVAFASFILAAAIPFLAVLSPSVRAKPAPLRVLGVLVLAGIALHVAWYIIPVFGYGPILPALLSGLTLALLAMAALPVVNAARLRHGP
jgi:hypothetical protein